LYLLAIDNDPKFGQHFLILLFAIDISVDIKLLLQFGSVHGTVLLTVADG
jgi:hypothetical protein